MSTLELRTYEILKLKLGEKEAETVIEYFDAKAEEKIQYKKDIFLTKDDKVDLIKWMVGLTISSIGILATLTALLFNYYLKNK